MFGKIWRTSIALFLVATSTGSAVADSAWWHLCGTCQSESDFRIAAIASDGEDEIVFVSNPESAETMKFNKFSTWEDFGNGMVRMTHVSEAEFPQQEREAFRDALEKSQVVFSTVESDLVNAYAGVPFYSSALFAVRNGRLGNSFFFGLQASINSQGLLPTRESVGANAAVNIRGLGGANVGANDSIRVVPLALRVQYPDGSHINAIYNPDGSWSEVSVVDIDGNTIDINVDQALNPIIVASVIGDYSFAGEDIRDAANDFAQAVRLAARPGSALVCHWEEHAEGGRIVCTRQ